MAERVGERVVRLLGMVAYLDGHGEVEVDELARQFGVSPAQVLEDLDTLWVSGTPGYLPYDLIDFDAAAFERGVVRLTEARGLTRPLRLGAREAIALVAALRALAADLSPALAADQRAAVDSALAKLTAATGAPAALDVRLAVDVSPQVAATISNALAVRRRLELRYVSSSDVQTQRVVDPLRLVSDDAGTYLLAWCLAADAERLFRLDRVLDARLLDESAAAHDVAPDADVFMPVEGTLVTLHLRSRGRWIAESAPVERVRNLDDGTFEVDLRVQQEAWLTHLLLRAGDDVLTVRPAAAAATAAQVARRALDAYDDLVADDGAPVASSAAPEEA